MLTYVPEEVRNPCFGSVFSKITSDMFSEGWVVGDGSCVVSVEVVVVSICSVLTVSDCELSS